MQNIRLPASWICWYDINHFAWLSYTCSKITLCWLTLIEHPAGPPLGDGGVGMAEEIWDNELREILCGLTFLCVMLKIPKSSLKS